MPLFYSELGFMILTGFEISGNHENMAHKDYIGLDACAVNLKFSAMYGAYHHITVMGKENLPLDHKYDVTGSLCENNDKFYADRMLLKNSKGRYSGYSRYRRSRFCHAGYNYNGKLKSAELLLKEDGSVQLIRRCRKTVRLFCNF